MRDLLTYIGIALILALSAAFAAPLLFDFDSIRPRIAEELTQATGVPIRLDGPIAVRFLPTPRFSADHLETSGNFGRLRAGKAVFALSLPALLSGKLLFSRALLEDAEIAIDSDRARRPDLAGALQFDNLVLRRAHLTILRAGTPVADIANLDVAAQFPSLQGPFTGRGAFDGRGQRIAFSFATDLIAKNGMPLKASLTWPGDNAKLDLYGRVDLARSPAFDGEAKAAGKLSPGAWTAQGPALVWLDGALVKRFSARLGDGPLADKVSGSMRFKTASGKLVLALEAPALSAPWTDYFAALALAAKDGGEKDGGPPVDLRASVDSLEWRGMDWSQAQLIWAPGAPAQLSATGPGAARVDISAAKDKDGWRGKARLKASDFAAFAAALREAAPAAGRALAGVSIHAADLAGDFTATPAEWALTGASLALDRALLSGDIRLRPAKGDARPLLVARLSAPTLDLDAAPDFAWGETEGLDLDLSLEAQTVRSTRGGQVSDDGGRIVAHLLRAGEAMRLERLDMRNIGGADLTASAAWGKGGAGLQGEARLKAGDLAPLAQAFSRLWPGAAAKAVAARAKSLSPADLAGKAADGAYTLNGTLGETRIAASVAPGTDGAPAVSIDLAAPEAGPLLNQLGSQMVWAQRLGAARVSARAQPDPLHPGARTVTASADLAGLRAEFRGGVADSAPNPEIAGDATLAGDAGKMLAAFAAAPAAPVTLRLAARTRWRDGALNLQNLDGLWAGDKVSGALSADSDGIRGALHCDRLSAPALAALVLGPPAPVKAGALWSSLSFAPVSFDPPSAKLAVETGDLQPLGGKARFDLALGPGALSVAGAEIEVWGGMLRGGFDLRRDGGQVTLSGEAEGDNVALKNPALSARLAGKLKFAGNGANAAALVGSLAGDGAAALHDIAIEGAAPGAPDQALAAGESNAAPFDAREVAKSLDAAFAREALRRPEANFTIRIAGGQASFAPMDVKGQGDPGAQGIEAGFDLRDASLSLAVSAPVQTLPPNWNGETPRGIVLWSGPWRTPERRIDANAFVNAVAVRALEREQARIVEQKRQDLERLRALTTPPAPSLSPEVPTSPAH